LFGLSGAGVLLFFLFFISIISILYVSSTKEMTLESYFFANKNIHGFLLSLSLLSGCLISPYIFGLISIESSSLLIIIYGIISVAMLLVLGWFIVPIYLREKINSLPEYFEKRFNRSCKIFLSILYVFYNIFFRLIIILTIGNILINQVTGVDAYSSILFFIIIAGVYVVIGGLQAEIYINAVQMIFLAFGVIIFWGWLISGYGGIHLAFLKTISFSFSDAIGNSEFTWPGLMFGLPIIGFWFWCADQFMVQKVLSARNIYSVRKATLVSVFLQLIPVLIFILPAIILFSLFNGIESKEAFHALFTTGILPEGIRMGVIIAVAAALMSSFASLYNSTSYLITFDFYRSVNPGALDKKLVLIGRLTIIILLFFSVLLIPVSQNLTLDLCFKLFYAFSYFASMTAAIFLIGLLSKKINSTSVVITLTIETCIILLKTSLTIFASNNFLGNDLFSRLLQLKFLEFSLFVFLSSIISSFFFSYLTVSKNFMGIYRKGLNSISTKIKYKRNIQGVIFLILLILVVFIVWGVLFD
jgi:SSS family solute:Na+ symporter